MFKPTVSISKSGPGVRDLEAALNKLKRSDVYVGIPASNTMRPGSQMNNATLLFIHSNGSALHNIPARPVLEPAIANAKDMIVPELGQATQAVFEKRPEDATRHLKRAGTIGANAAKRRVGSDELAPNAPSTIKRKGSERPLIDTGELRRSITSVLAEE